MNACSKSYFNSTGKGKNQAIKKSPFLQNMGQKTTMFFSEELFPPFKTLDLQQTKLIKVILTSFFQDFATWCWWVLPAKKGDFVIIKS